jgi:tetratricopeptide (TPR) repeat protein
MKSEFQPRPESKSIKTTIRPSSHYSNPDLASECFKKGKELQTNGTYERATEQYFRALMYDPKYFQAYCNIGSCYRSQGKYLEARSMYLKSI